MSDPTITIDGEHDAPRGWVYTFHVQWDDGSQSDHELSIAWVDHEHLGGGVVTPSAVATRACQLASQHFGKQELPSRFDLSSLRRLIPNFEDQFKSGLNDFTL